MDIPVGYAQATFVYGGSVLPYGAVNTIGVDLAGTFDGVDLAHFLYDEWALVWPANADAQASLRACQVKYGPTSTGPTYEWTEGTNGSVSGVACPPNTALLVQKQTTLGGRHGRGRMYLPAVSSSALSETGVVDNSIVVDLNARLATFLDHLLTEGHSAYLFHSTVSDPTLIDSLQCSSTLATQRKRMRR